MWLELLSSPAARAIALTLAGALVLTGAILGYRAWQRSRITPEERERRRRAHLAAIGKMGDATLVEISEEYLTYSYGVRGVEYTASQDVTCLKEYIPEDFSEILAVSVKYDRRNPANSIVVAEQWSGLRARKAG